MSEGSPTQGVGDLLGRVIGGRYRLGALLGQGGMGVVYTATQESLARPVAVKVLQPALAQNLDAVARFRAEAERAGRLAHPHIVQILDFGHETDGSAWIAMELLSGSSLAARIERGPMSEAEVVKVGLETLSALEAAHGASLVHRDLKPDNIFLAEVPGIGTTVKILDFGIAKLLDGDGASKLTATGMLVGTPLYMAPEQARGEDVNARSDLYSVGCVLYEALTGRPPLTGKNYNALLFAILSETPEPVDALRPSVSRPLAEIVMRAIEKRPVDRFGSAREMSDALRAVIPSASIPPAPMVRDTSIATAPTLATPQPALASAPAALATAPTLATPQSAASGLARASTPAPAPASASVPSVPVASQPAQSGSNPRMIAMAIAGALAAAVLVLVLDRTLLREPPPTPTPVTQVAAPTVPSPPTPPPMVPMGPPPTIGVTPPSPTEAPPPAIVEPEVALQMVTDEPDRPVRGARPRPTPHAPRYAPSVSLGSFRFGGMASSAALRGPIEAEGGWSACWPGDVEPPTVNMSRDFWIDIAADGSVISAEPTAASTQPPEFASCVVRKLRTITFPAPVTGERVRVQVGFGIGT